MGNEGEYTEHGLKVALAEAVATKMHGVEIRVRLYPWKRCQELARRGEVDGILPLFKTPEREKYLLYSDASWQQQSSFWFNKRKFPSGLSWSYFDELSHLRLGMLRGGFINQNMEAAFEAKASIHRAGSVKQLFAMLMADNLDLVAVDSSVGQYVTRREHWMEDIRQAQKPIDEKDAYFALSKKSAAAQLLPQFNDAITAVKEDALQAGRAVQSPRNRQSH